MRVENKRYVYGLDLAWSTGIAIYDLEEDKFVYVSSCDAKKTKLRAQEKRDGLLEHGKKLRTLAVFLEDLFNEYPPSQIVIEKAFAGQFKNAVISLSKVHGMVNEMTADIPCVYYTPPEIKKAIIKGGADKEVIAKVISAKYNYLTFKNDDESDATAVALTYLIKNNLIKWEK